MNITKTSDIENHHIFALIVGASGVGKTSLAKTLNHDETLILSAESGLLSIKDVSIDVVTIKSREDLLSTFDTLANTETKYKNIFIDSLTEIGQVTMTELEPDFTPAQTFGLWKKYEDRIVNLVKAFRDMAKYNIYFTALDKMETKDHVNTISIDLKKAKLSKSLPAYFDEVFYYQKHKREDGSITRALCTDSDDVDFTKDRSGKLDKYEKPDLQAINDKIFK